MKCDQRPVPDFFPFEDYGTIWIGTNAASCHPERKSGRRARKRGVQANRIDKMFATLDRRPALILYLTAGHPDLSTSERLARIVAEGADLIEIGIPFSDPLADGPVIQASSQIALREGTTVQDCLEVVEHLRATIETPIVFLTYYNPILRYGLSRFADACAAGGVDGVIVADLPPEEAAVLRSELWARGLHLIPLVAPTSTDERLAFVCDAASGFIYCVSRTGVTGIRDTLAADLATFLARVRAHTDLPRAVGFGISRPEHVRLVGGLAEGVIIGSALVDLIERTPATERDEAVRAFVTTMRQAILRENTRGSDHE